MPAADTSVAVTGASGFLGRALVAALDASGVAVLPVARRSVVGLPRAVAVVDDYADTPAANVIVHLAEPNDRAQVVAMGDCHVAAVTATTAALLERAQRVVYASSALVYGAAETRPRRPDDTTLADDLYARGKLACEALVNLTGGTVVRLANLYGPGMADSTVVATILSQIPGDGPLWVLDDTPVRDFLWIDDAVEALALICQDDTARGIFNVGSGQGLSVGNMARLALAAADEQHRPVKATRPAGQLSSLILDISATQQQLGWRPRRDPAAAFSKLLSTKGQSA